MTRQATILFVCPHGAAKSVLAAADLERPARARGLAARAEFAGAEPDREIAPRVLAELLAEGVDLGGRRSRRVTREDVAGAAPAVSDDFRKARAAIQSRLARLLDDLS
jgi:protein-tyrosine-phosphatase